MSFQVDIETCLEAQYSIGRVVQCHAYCKFEPVATGNKIWAGDYTRCYGCKPKNNNNLSLARADQENGAPGHETTSHQRGQTLGKIELGINQKEVAQAKGCS